MRNPTAGIIRRSLAFFIVLTTGFLLGLPQTAQAQKSQPVGLTRQSISGPNVTATSGQAHRPSARPYVIVGAAVAVGITGLLIQRAANTYYDEMMVDPVLLIVPALLGSALVGAGLGYAVYRVGTLIGVARDLH